MLKMRIRKLVTLYKNNFEKRNNFKHLADWLAENATKDLDEERKAIASESMALGMAMGDEMGAGKYLLIGTAIGALGTGLAATLLYNDSKKRRDTEEEEVGE
jgi:hypothetical protein